LRLLAAAAVVLTAREKALFCALLLYIVSQMGIFCDLNLFCHFRTFVSSSNNNNKPTNKQAEAATSAISSKEKLLRGKRKKNRELF